MLNNIAALFLYVSMLSIIIYPNHKKRLLMNQLDTYFHTCHMTHVARVERTLNKSQRNFTSNNAASFTNRFSPSIT
jgi:hypothetical protein